jgi:uncharacterized phage protein (TIGR02218 family)
MSRTIPISLQAHLDTGATTTCGILRIEPVRPGYSVIGLTDLDRNVDYDDGDGEVTYLAPVGFTASAYVATADFAVDNAESKSLFPEFDVPQLTEADINAGVYDYARYKLMLVNYEDLTQGHAILSTGTLGEMKTIDGLAFMGELRSLFQQFRQSIVERDSLTCRATFGSQSADSSDASTAPKIERFPCGVVVDGLWADFEVSQIGVESDLVFSLGGIVGGNFAPGLVEWLTGANAGRQYEVSSYDSTTGIVTLSFPTAFPIVEGDTGRIRPDCTKQWSGPSSCFTYNNRLNFRGEPFIPTGDAGSTSTPGAESGTGILVDSAQEATDAAQQNDPPAATTPATLVNGDFEAGNTGWAVVSRASPPSPGYVITNDSGMFGSWLCRWTGDPGGAQDRFRNAAVPLTPDQLFVCDGQIRCTAHTGGGAVLQAGVMLELFQDEACTISLGNTVSQFVTFSGVNATPTRVTTFGQGGGYMRLSLIVTQGIAIPVTATIEFDNVTWNVQQVVP